MPKSNKPARPAKQTPEPLKGWDKIAEFLGQTVSVAQRWQKSGMPVERQGRNVVAAPADLTRWVGTQEGKSEPVHIASEDEDLVADLKQGLSYVRRQRRDTKV